MGLIVGLADKHEMKWAKDGKGQAGQSNRAEHKR